MNGVSRTPEMIAAAKDLRPLLAPRSIAVVGASTRMNRASGVLSNLKKCGYRGVLYPINPKYEEIAGL
jgi:acetyltransferase